MTSSFLGGSHGIYPLHPSSFLFPLLPFPSPFLFLSPPSPSHLPCLPQNFTAHRRTMMTATSPRCTSSSLSTSTLPCSTSHTSKESELFLILCQHLYCLQTLIAFPPFLPPSSLPLSPPFPPSPISPPSLPPSLPLSLSPFLPPPLLPFLPSLPTV